MWPVIGVTAAGIVSLMLVAGLTSVVAQIVLHKTKLNADGTVTIDGTNPIDPEVLARDAGLSVEELALARMVQSEAGTLPQAARIGVAYAALRHSAGAGGIAKVLTHSSGAGDGFFGRQDQGRYAATSQDHTAASLAAAQAALNGSIADPTGGADQWDSPQSYPSDDDSTSAEKAAATADRRMAAGKEVVLIDGVPERKIRFWRSA